MVRQGVEGLQSSNVTGYRVIVVADSGPLIHLAAVNQFRLLNRLFQHLLITPQVHEEVGHSGNRSRWKSGIAANAPGEVDHGRGGGR
jgi:hypothetical protein